MPSTIFSGSKVKALKDRFSLNDVTEIISVSADPTSGGGVAAPLGSIAMDYLAGKVYKKTGSLATEWQELGAGLGGINYIDNPDAESGVTGWTVYDETDAVTFTDAGDLVTLNNHGLQNGQMVMFRSIVSTTGITTLVRYYVVSATTNTFQVASSVGGSALALTTNGTGVMTRDRPKLGTGGTPNFQWTRDDSAPLRGVADFNLKKYASPGSSLGSLGQGVSYDFTIDRADQAKVLTVSFDYEWLQQSSGGISGIDITDRNLTVYIIQDPTSTPVVIQPAGYQVQLAQIGTKMRHIATFQTASNVTSYRLCLHAGNVTNFFDELALDNISVGPQVVQYGAPVTDSQAYTPTGSWVTNTTYTGEYRRVGDILEAEVTLALSGAPTAAILTVNLPAGLSIDASKLTTSTNTTSILGQARIRDNTGSSRVIGDVAYNNATSVYVFYLISGSNAETNVTATAPFTFATGDRITLWFRVPILGWSSTVQMSNDTDTRVVAAAAEALSTGAYSTTAPLNFSTVKFDTHGALTTGASWKFTAPVPGYYRVSIAGTYAGAATGTILNLYKNGSPYSGLVNYPSVAGYRVSASETVYLEVGEYVDIRPGASISILPGYVSVERLSGPSAIAASESVNARASTTANSIPNNSLTIVDFGTKSFDSHGAITTGASWNFRAPMAGKYRVSAGVQFADTTGTYTSELAVYKNGSPEALLGQGLKLGSSSAAIAIGGTVTVSLQAGDTIDIRVQQNTGVSLALRTTTAFGLAAAPNNVSIERIGN